MGGVLLMKYRVTTSGYGGEFVQGTLPDTTATYWIERGQDALENHLVLGDVKDVPKEYDIYPWYENSNISHVNGAEMSASNNISITVGDTDEVVMEGNMMDEWVTELAYVLNDEPIKMPDNERLLTNMSIEKGYWEYELIEDDQFDVSKLKLLLISIDGSCVLSHLSYGGQELGVDDGGTRGKEFRVYWD
jgi:hypothetical protein